MAEALDSRMLCQLDETWVAGKRRAHPGCLIVIEERDGRQCAAVYPAPPTDVKADILFPNLGALIHFLTLVIDRRNTTTEDGLHQVAVACGVTQTILEGWMDGLSTPSAEYMDLLITFGEPRTGPNWVKHMQALAARSNP